MLRKDRRMEGNKIKDVRSPFRVEKAIDDNIINDIRNLSRLKENEAIKNRTTRDIRNIIRLKEQNELIKERIIRDLRNIFWPKKKG